MYLPSLSVTYMTIFKSLLRADRHFKLIGADRRSTLLSRRSKNDACCWSRPAFYRIGRRAPGLVTWYTLEREQQICEMKQWKRTESLAGFSRITCQDDQDIPDIQWNRFLQIIASPTLQSGLIYVEYERRNGRYSMSGSALLILLTAHCCGSAVRLNI